MMFDMPNIDFEPLPRKNLLQVLRNTTSAMAVTEAAEHEPKIRASTREIAQLPPKICPAVLVQRDIVEIARPDPSLSQTISDRVRRKPCPMLYAAETFLFGRRDELPVADQSR